jgi:gamma-tubulin complex component 3
MLANCIGIILLVRSCVTAYLSSHYRYAGILQGALRSSNAQFEPSHIMNRIIVRLNDVKPGEIGWEAFTLDYAVDSPLNAIVSAK